MEIMTFHIFNPSTDTLEVGTKIRLAGREGEIVGEALFNGFSRAALYPIKWQDEYVSPSEKDKFIYTKIDLYSYPLLEIADKPAKPLTIDKRVKENIFGIIDDIPSAYAEVIGDYLNSLEET